MTTVLPQLSDLRAEIDSIDDAIHDLLMRRAALVRDIASAKGPGAATLRPAREAQVLRRLIARHAGPLPVSTVFRIWREMMAAFTRMQGPFAAAVHAGPEGADGADLREIARDHFGADTPLTIHRSAANVLQAVDRGQGVVGLLPPIDGDDPDSGWWSYLAGSGGATGAGGLSVIARLPFVTDAAAGGNAVGWCVARGALEPSGDDLSLIAITARTGLSRASVIEKLRAQGLTARMLALREDTPGERVYLVEADTFVRPDDVRLAAVARGDILHVRVIGAYARPVTLAPATGA